MSVTVFLNGQYLPQDQAKISVMDRGFLFGDSVYAVIPVYDGAPLALQEHVQRLNQNCQQTFIEQPYSLQEWSEVISHLVQRNQAQAGHVGIYIQISRGADLIRSHAIPSHLSPTVVAFCTFPHFQTQHPENGFSAIILHDMRRKDNRVKATALLPNILSYDCARQQGALEAILVRDGEVLECTSSNVFVVKDGVLLTPVADERIFAGVTREIVLRLARKNGWVCREECIAESQLKEADEIWVTGSMKEICPITYLDGQAVGQGRPGPYWEKMSSWYRALKEKPELLTGL